MIGRMILARDLQVRLILAHLAVTLVGLLLVGAVFAALLNREVSSTHQRDLRNETQTLAHQLNRALARNARRPLMQRLISTDAQLTGKRVILLDSQGHVAYDSARWTPLSAGSWRLLDRSDPSGQHSTRLQCVAGRVIDVSADALDVRNFHGSIVKVSLTPDTLFQTDSAAGSIQGIASGDFACVAVASHPEGPVAVRVFFDLRMFPCGPWGRHHHHHAPS